MVRNYSTDRHDFMDQNFIFVVIDVSFETSNMVFTRSGNSVKSWRGTDHLALSFQLFMASERGHGRVATI